MIFFINNFAQESFYFRTMKKLKEFIKKNDYEVKEVKNILTENRTFILI